MLSDNATLLTLFRLSFTQRRRDFKWQTLFVYAYFLGLTIIMAVGVGVGLSEMFIQWSSQGLTDMFALMMVTSFVLVDFMFKLFWHHDAIEMDDSLRSRPVSRRAWNRFVLVSQLTSELTYLTPALVLIVSLVVRMSWPYVVLSVIMSLMVSLFSSLYRCSWRRAPGNAFTLPLLFAFIFYYVVVTAYAVCDLMVKVWMGMVSFEGEAVFADSSRWWVSPLLCVGFMALQALCIYILFRYFSSMKNYNENASAVTHVRTDGHVSLTKMELTAVRRSKRLRNSFLIIAPIFLLNTYIQQMPDVVSEFGFNVMLLFGVGFPSVTLVQYSVGIEPNFIHGIWSKPWRVEDILINKYRFYCMICILMAVCCLPAVVWMDMSFWTLLCATLFSMGIFVLSMMPMCLYCSRVDLFASAFFNYQSANKQMNIYSFIIFVPMIIYYLLMWSTPLWVANVICGALGLAGLLLHVVFLRWLARMWKSRRYALMESWSS